MIPTIAMSLIGSILIMFQPESPRFYVGIGKYNEARAVFNKIAYINGKGVLYASNFIFKEEHEQVYCPDLLD